MLGCIVRGRRRNPRLRICAEYMVDMISYYTSIWIKTTTSHMTHMGRGINAQLYGHTSASYKWSYLIIRYHNLGVLES